MSWLLYVIVSQPSLCLWVWSPSDELGCDSFVINASCSAIYYQCPHPGIWHVCLSNATWLHANPWQQTLSWRIDWLRSLIAHNVAGCHSLGCKQEHERGGSHTPTGDNSSSIFPAIPTSTAASQDVFWREDIVLFLASFGSVFLRSVAE